MNLKKWLGIGARKAARLAADDSVRKQFTRLEVENDILKAERDYWKAKAETLIDAALAKAGHTPVMQHQSLAGASAAIAQPFLGLRVTTVTDPPARAKEATRS